MNKLLIILSLIALSNIVLAEQQAPTGVKENPHPKGTLTNPIRRKVSRENWLKHTGGQCEGDTKGKRYVFLDATKSGCSFAKPLEQMRTGCGIAIRSDRMELGTREPFAAAREFMNSHADVGGVTLFYDGTADAPVETEYPMDKIAVVNVTPLRTTSDAVFQRRLTATTCRSMMFVAGGVYPFGVIGSMRPVFSPSDFDLLKSEYAHPSAAQLVAINAPAYGFSLHKRGTYRNACVGGWAPLPTNDYQKAIWNEVHAIPKNPMQIQFDPTMGR